jgi:dTDP-glucose pyrophosphorylase
MPSMPQELSNSIISEAATLREAMQAINAGDLAGVVMVVGPDGRLVGLMTDGDIRRMLLGGATLETHIAGGINREFTWVAANTSRAHVIDLMRARSIEHIPVLNSQGYLIGVHRLGDMILKHPLPNIAVVMAGGRGSRLGDLTRETPKPMLKVAGRPILERIVLHLVGCGIQRIYIAVNYLSQVIEDHFGDGRHFGCEIHYLREEVPLGSGGALTLLPETPRHPLLVMNGDLVTDFHVRRLLDYHESGNYAATMGLTPYQHQVPFGCAKVEKGEITAFHEKPVMTKLVNSGIYAISPHLTSRVPRGYFPITDLFAACLERGEPVGGYEITEDWTDIGLPKELDLARGNV